MNILPKVSSLPSLLAMNLVKMEHIDFSNRPHVGHLVKGSCFGASYTKSATCLVSCRYIFCRLRHAFYLSHDPIKPLHLDVIHIYGWELLAACHHPEKFGDHRHSDSKRKNASVDLINMDNHWARKKCHSLKNIHFEKKCPKTKKHIFPLNDYLLWLCSENRNQLS